MIKIIKKIKSGKKKFGENGSLNHIIGVTAALIIGLIVFLISRNLLALLISIITFFLLIEFYFIIRKRLKMAADVRKMEDSFPDFIELMSSNLRAGMTIDKALILSSRKEFAPLDKEILSLGKDIITGREVSRALKDMADRIGSEKIHKTINLIISGIRSGGNLSILLEETATNMRERNYVEKRAASNVLMYVIFIFFAVSIGAPLLFGLSSVLVEILTKILSNFPETQNVSSNLPFSITKINITVKFVIYFAMAFLIVIDFLASLVLGLVGKGQEREGLKYTVPLIVMSISVFFITRFAILRYFTTFFNS